MPAPCRALATSVRAQKCGMVMSVTTQIIFPYMSDAHAPAMDIRMSPQDTAMALSFWQNLRSILRGDWVRSLFTPFDARAHFILYPCRSPHGGRLKDPMTWLHAHGPCACSRQGPSISAQGARKWEGQRSRRAATRATAAPRPERTNKAFDFVAWKGGVACSEAVQTMGAWLARCGRVPVQRVARSHATVSVSPIREELGR